MVSDASSSGDAESPPVYRPNLARHRRHFDKYPNPVAWVVPLLILALGAAAVLKVLPDIALKPTEFAKAFERAHRDDVKKYGAAPQPRARALADSIAHTLQISAGFPARLEASGAVLLRASGTHLLSGTQLHLLVQLPGSRDQPASLFAEKFVARNVDLYRRREVEGGRLYFHSEPAQKHLPADSVMVWQEVGVLATVLGGVREDSLAAFGSRMLRLSRAAHAADLE